MNITEQEAQELILFIDNSLDAAWDRYTDHYIVSGVSWEEGKRRMNPDMYALMNKLEQQLWEDIDEEV